MTDPAALFWPETEIERQVADIVSRLSYGDWHFKMVRGAGCFVLITWAVRDLHAQPPGLFDHQYRFAGLTAGRSGWTFLNTSVDVSRLEHVGEHWLDLFLESLWAAITELEGHERLERLRVDGIPVWSPHPYGEQQVAPGRVRSSPVGLQHTVRLAETVRR